MRRPLPRAGRALQPHPASGTWSRFAVVGSSATGKTNLAVLLSGRRGLAHIELDQLRWPGGPEPEPEGLSARLEELIRGGDWVVEGVQHSPGVRLAWARADAVVWLDHSRLGVVARMMADNLWTDSGWRTVLDPRRPEGRYLVGKSIRSWRQATQLRADLPRALEELSRQGVVVFRLRSVLASRRWSRLYGAERTT